MHSSRIFSLGFNLVCMLDNLRNYNRFGHCANNFRDHFSILKEQCGGDRANLKL